MSINSMANAAAARRADIGLKDRVPNGLAEIAQASRTTPVSAPADGSGAKPDDGGAPSTTDTAYNVLFGYIPTEILTVYVAFLAALNADKVDRAADNVAFFSFLVATPIVVWLAYGAKVLAAGKPAPLKFDLWPLWEMFAATVAYAAWTVAMPAATFDTNWHVHFESLSGVLVLVTATALGLLAPYFQNCLGKSASSQASNGAPASGSRSA